MHGLKLLTMMLVTALFVHGLPYTGHYISPASEMVAIGAATNTGKHYGMTGEDCALMCLVTPKCVAFITRTSGDGMCKLKKFLDTLTQRLVHKPGHEYFYLNPQQYNRTGCFKHDTRDNFLLITGRYTRGYTGQEEEASEMITGCGAVAWKRGYEVFGIEYGGECWVTYKSVDYQADGMASDNDTDGCMYDIGIGDRMISVFEF